jgi:hypothetical protein
MYKLDSVGRPRLNGKCVPVNSLPTSKKFVTPAGPCVVVAKNLDERVALANAETPEDIEGYEEAVKVAQGG